VVKSSTVGGEDFGGWPLIALAANLWDFWSPGETFHDSFETMNLLRELWAFMRARKKLWLAPLLIVFLVFGGLIALTAGSSLAPLIYSIF
jgi:hypothetical protein